jgi:hypothetical protein
VTAEALAYYLASAVVMCALPYLAALGEAEDYASLRAAAGRAGVLTSLD